MRKFLFGILAFGIILNLGLSSVLAQVNSENEEIIPPSEEEIQAFPTIPEREDIPNTVSCFDDYTFGSVQVDVSPSALSTIPGVPLTFSGTIKNNNPYPLVDGSVYVKIFKKQATHSNTDLNTKQNGPEVVDQFFAKQNISLKSQGSSPILFIWNIPRNMGSGDYIAATYFVTAQRFNLAGLSFTDDVTGNKSNFSIKSDVLSSPVFFNKNTVTLNQKPHKFAIYPLRFSKDENVTAEAELINSSKEDKAIDITWTLYTWDGLREENKKDEKTETITLKSNETKKISYTVTKNTGSVAYLIVEAKDGEAKSILGIRFVREGIDETRLNFPSITSYPLAKDTQNSLFSCVHSTNSPVIKDNTLILTLKTLDGQIIHKYTYQGDISGEMMGVKENFTPKQTTRNFTLTATLKHKGKTVEEVTQTYLCDKLSDNCPKPAPASLSQASDFLGEKGMWLRIILFLVGAVLLFFVIKRIVMRRSTFLFLIGFVLAGSLMVGVNAPPVEAKSAVANAQVNEWLYYVWAYAHPIGPELIDHNHNFVKGLHNPNISIIYNAFVTDTLGSPLLDGASVPVGSQLKFQFKPYENTDISWFGTGYAADSPYGRWVAGAGAPTAPVGGRVPFWPSVNDHYREKHLCDSYDYVFNESTRWGDGVLRYILVYIPLSVNPPIKGFTLGSSNLSCEVPDGNGDVLCTATAAGPIDAHMTFNETYAKFYHRQYDPRGVVTGSLPGCYGTNIPMNSSLSDLRVIGSDYSIPIPSQTIPFTFNAVPAQNAPTKPVLTGDTSGVVSQLLNFTADNSTDPEGDDIRYGFDFDIDGNGIPNVSDVFWMPYVPRNSSPSTPPYVYPSQTKDYNWLSNGTRQVAAIAQDTTAGNYSPWSDPLMVTITTPSVDLQINGSDGPLNLTQGQTKNVSWTMTNMVSCTASSSDGWAGNKAVPSGSESLPANTSSLHTLTCLTPINTPVSDSVQVNVSCNESTGTWGACTCTTEKKSRTNIAANCIPWTEETDCTASEKNSCRNFNWKEVAP